MVAWGIGASKLQFPFLEVDGHQAEVHAIGNLVLRLGAAVKDVACVLVEPVEDFARLGVHFADVLQGVVTQ